MIWEFNKSVLSLNPFKGEGKGTQAFLVWDEYGRGAPFKVKLGRTGRCSRVGENEFPAYIMISATMLSTFFH